MSGYTENFRVESGTVCVRLSGHFPNELLREAKNLFQPLIEACSAQECKKALIDATDLEADLGTMGLFRAGQDAAALTFLGLRVAIVAKEAMVDRFFEDVAANRGGNIRVFTDMDAARDWLRE